MRRCVVPGRLELPTSTLSVWRSNQLSYRTLLEERERPDGAPDRAGAACPFQDAFLQEHYEKTGTVPRRERGKNGTRLPIPYKARPEGAVLLQKGGVP